MNFVRCRRRFLGCDVVRYWVHGIEKVFSRALMDRHTDGLKMVHSFFFFASFFCSHPPLSLADASYNTTPQASFSLRSEAGKASELPNIVRSGHRKGSPAKYLSIKKNKIHHDDKRYFLHQHQTKNLNPARWICL